MIKQVTCSSIVGIVLSISGCHAMNATTAERCVFIDLQAEKGRELMPLLEAFAANSGLESNKSHPVNPRFEQLSSAGEIRAEVSYRIGYGEFGSMLSLFRYEKAGNADLLEQFDRYVEDVIARKYTVTPCEPEQYPTTYR